MSHADSTVSKELTLALHTFLLCTVTHLPFFAFHASISITTQPGRRQTDRDRWEKESGWCGRIHLPACAGPGSDLRQVRDSWLDSS